MNLSVILGRLLEICDASKAAKEQIRSWCKKADKDADEVISYVEGQFPDSNNKQLAAARWICVGYEPKFFGQALYICEQKKLDPMHQNPEDLVKQNPDVKPKEKAIDPDTVLTDRQEDGEGNVTYAARDEDREVLRQIINTHYGKDASPWCLLQGDRNGKLTETSEGYWRSYSAYPKRVAFRDGKLLAFSAGNKGSLYSYAREWWDRFDRSFPFIPYNGKTWESDGGVQFSIEDGEVYRKTARTHARLSTGYSTDIEASEVEVRVSGNSIMMKGAYYPIVKKDDKYYYVDNDDITSSTRGSKFKMDRKTLQMDGDCVFALGGVAQSKGHYKKGKKDGVQEIYTNGQLTQRYSCKNGNIDGVRELFYEGGQLREKSIYKNGKQNGVNEFYYEDGQLLQRVIWKDDMRDGREIAYYNDGSLRRECTYKNDKLNGAFLSKWKNGNTCVKCTYKDGKKDGLNEQYYQSGQLRTRCEYKNGEADGLYEDFYMDGQLRSKAIYKDGNVVEILKQ